MAELRQNTWQLDEWYDQAVAGNAGYESTIAQLFVWGYNAGNGALMQNNRTTLSSPTQVGTDTNWQYVGTGRNNRGVSSAVKTDGTLWINGLNSYGQLGQNNRTSCSSPAQIPGDWGSRYVSHGYWWSAALKSDGSIWTWGQNTGGQLGQGPAPWPIGTQHLSSPMQVGTETTWAQFGGGNQTIVATKTDGTLWSWGDSNYGATGQNIWTQFSSPKQVGTDTDWATGDGVTTVGDKHCLQLKAEGSLWSWGRNDDGQLAQNSKSTGISSPIQVGTGTDYKLVGSGTNCSFAIKTNGTLWAWGNNNQGGLGLNDVADRSSPVQVGTATNWVNVMGAASGNTAFGIKGDGSLWGWGGTNQGELGQNISGNTDRRSSPTQIPGDWAGGVRQLGMVRQSSMALKLI